MCPLILNRQSYLELCERPCVQHLDQLVIKSFNASVHEFCEYIQNFVTLNSKSDYDIFGRDMDTACVP